MSETMSDAAQQRRAEAEQGVLHIALALNGLSTPARIIALAISITAEMECLTGGVPENRADFVGKLQNTMAALIRDPDQKLMDQLKAMIRGVPVPPSPPPPMGNLP